MKDSFKLTTLSKKRNEEVYIDVVQSLLNSMAKELDASNELYTVSIYRVSEKYRKSNEEAYTPRAFSIGPIHYGKSHLQAMNAYKLHCLKGFIDKWGKSLLDLIEYAENCELAVRGCYQDTSMFDSEMFCKMILLDGIFVVHLFVRNFVKGEEYDGDLLFQNPWVKSDLMHDMLLLENQLPLSFITGLFGFVDQTQVYHTSFLELSFVYYEQVGNTREKSKDCWRGSRHLLEFLLILHTPSRITEGSLSHKGRFDNTRFKSASELWKAGVRFVEGLEAFYEVSFEDGRLKLPRLTVNNNTETCFRNLIAYEQFGHREKYITSYVIFMDRLINTAEDVELLVKHNVIHNLLGEAHLVAELFNNMYKDVDQEGEFYFTGICHKLDAYSKDYIHEWKSTWFKWKLILKKQYLGNPWSVIAFIAASLVIVLAVIQTVCSILGLKVR